MLSIYLSLSNSCYTDQYNTRYAIASLHGCRLSTVAENKTCHEECSSRTDCWGPEDHQCDIDRCLNFQYKNRCVPDCSNASLRLSEEDSGVYQNEEMKLCEDCHIECLGGCRNGTVSEYMQLMLIETSYGWCLLYEITAYI